MVHQHFMLVPVFTVAENVMLGVEPTGPLGRLERAEAHRRVAELSERYGLAVDPDATVEDLPVGIQQRVEILKALYRDARCLILDEPTAVLTPPEIDELMEIVRQLAEGDRSVIFISHKLREVLAIADRISVLRSGKVVGHTTPGRDRRAGAGHDDGRPRRAARGRQGAVRRPASRSSRSTTWSSATIAGSRWSTA